MVQIENCIAYFSKVILSDLKDMAGVRCWIAGGVVRDYFSSKPIVTDFDIFFPDEVNHKKAAEWFKRVNAEVIWESENGMKVKYKGKTFDLIKHYTDSPVACINSFDFTVSQFAVDSERLPEMEVEVLLFDDWKCTDGERRQDMKVGYLSEFTTRKTGKAYNCEWLPEPPIATDDIKKKRPPPLSAM